MLATRGPTLATSGPKLHPEVNLAASETTSWLLRALNGPQGPKCAGLGPKLAYRVPKFASCAWLPWFREEKKGNVGDQK